MNRKLSQIFKNIISLSLTGFLVSSVSTEFCPVTRNECSQMCDMDPFHPEHDKIQCFCMEGFQLGPNQRSCEPVEANWSLIYADRSNVGVIKRNGSRTRLIRESMSFPIRPVCVTCDGRSKVVYWTNAAVASETIYKSFMDEPGKVEVVADNGMYLPEGIAFDWITGNIYFADSNYSYVAVCRNTSVAESPSNLCAIVIHGAEANRPRDVALHPDRRIMFWTEWGSTPAIMSAGMDGTLKKAIVTRNVRWPNGIVVDIGNGRIYWADARIDVIESTDFDGRHRKIVTSSRHPFGVEVFGDRVYWTDWGTGEIKSADKFSGSKERVHLEDSNTFFNGLAMFSVATQPIFGENVCKSSNCSHICVLSPEAGYQYRCLCPVGMLLDRNNNHTCSELRDHAKLVFVFGDKVAIIRINSIGRNIFQRNSFPELGNITTITFMPMRHSVALSNQTKIFEYKLDTKELRVLVDHDLDSVSSLGYDEIGGNLYWSDSGKKTIEVMSLKTKARLVIKRMDETVSNIVIVSEHSLMYVSNGSTLHLTSLAGKKYRMLFRVIEPVNPVAAYDPASNSILWAGYGNNSISTLLMLPNGQPGMSFMILDIDKVLDSRGSTVSSIAKHENTLFWIDPVRECLEQVELPVSSHSGYIRSTQLLFDSEKKSGMMRNARMIITRNPSEKILRGLENHFCTVGNCSHLCIPIPAGDDELAGECLCPEGFLMKDDNKTCEDPAAETESETSIPPRESGVEATSDNTGPEFHNKTEPTSKAGDTNKDKVFIVIISLSGFFLIFAFIFMAIINYKKKESVVVQARTFQNPNYNDHSDLL